MGIFDRIRDGIRGRLDRTVEGIEQRNPEAVYTSAIETARASAVEHRSRAAAIAQHRNAAAERVEKLEREEAQLGVALDEALDEGDDDTALVLQVRRGEIAEQLEIRRAELASLTDEADAARQAVGELQEGIGRLERERDLALAQLASSSAMIDVQEAASGVSDTPHTRALQTVRESIERLEGRADPGWLDEEGNSVRGRADALGKKAAALTAQQQLEQLKRKRRGENEDEDEDK